MYFFMAILSVTIHYLQNSNILTINYMYISTKSQYNCVTPLIVQYEILL